MSKSDKEYLVTNLFNLYYFAKLKAKRLVGCFLPYDDEYDPKNFDHIMQRISILDKCPNDRSHPIYGYPGNIAHQGSTCSSLKLVHELISFEFFYSQLCFFEKNRDLFIQNIYTEDEIKKYYTKLDIDKTKKDIILILKTKKLYLTTNKEIPISIKNELIMDLESSIEIKQVLAKILYYIVKQDLPNNLYVYENIINHTNLKQYKEPNILMDFRNKLDSNIDDFEYLLTRYEIDAIQILAYDSISIFGDKAISENINFKLDVMKKILNNGAKLEIVLNNPDSQINKTQKKFKHLKINLNELSAYVINKLIELKSELNLNDLYIKTTTENMSYALFIVHYKDDYNIFDYIKVDLYSPFIELNNKRPSFYITKINTPELFNHFQEVFENIWNDGEYSTFI